MRFCLLTRFHSHHSNSSFVRRLQAEAQLAGHEFVFINPADLALTFGGGARPSECPVYLNGAPLPDFDLIHYALRWDDEHTWNIVEALRDYGRPVLPLSRVPLGDSITMARLFARAGVRTPRTWVLGNGSQLPIILPELSFPCLFRVRKGQQGRKLYKADHTGEALQIAEALSHGGHSFMVQDITPPTGLDVRAFVVGSHVVAALERVAPVSYIRPGEDNNLRVAPTHLNPAELKLVQTTMKIYNAPYAAISFLRREGVEPVLLEVSRAPTLTEVEAVTGVNVASAIIAFLAHEAKRYKASRKRSESKPA